MASTDGFTSIDELDEALYPSRGKFVDPEIFDQLSAIDLTGAIEEAKRISANTSDKAYRNLTKHGNCTSYSLLLNLHECPRKFELEKLQANAEDMNLVEFEPNLDFAFGHAVGAGIQTYAATKSLTAGQWAAFTSWKAPFDAVKTDKRGNPTGKSLVAATKAVETFAQFWEENLSDYEVVRLPSGKLAVELAFAVDFQNGFYHFGHIDTVLVNKRTQRLLVWEGKTTSSEFVQEPTYGNSAQALGYSVVIDKIAEELDVDGTEYEVLYIVFSSKTQQFQLLPFTKTRTQRAEWLQDTLLDHATIQTYRGLGFYPKRGESCANQYGKPCFWYGQCGMQNEHLFPGVKLPMLEAVEQVESVDFYFTRDELIAAQQRRNG